LETSVVVHENPWTDRDVDLAMAYEAVLADQCPGCGNPLSETTARENMEAVHEYAASYVRCGGCDARVKEQDDHSPKGAKGQLLRPEAVLWGVTKVR
jgi:uncharacterized protein with PIN domain